MAKSLAERRRISFAEYAALLGVRAMLASGELRHVEEDKRVEGHRFNMGHSCYEGACGTVSCVGGAIGLIIHQDIPLLASRYVSQFDGSWFARGDRSKDPMAALFYPPTEYDYGSITPAQAVRAIDNFLKNGKPRWKSILTKRQLERVPAG